uniref:Uncharacterized protein n=1 Tax=Candidatus Methanogaster sp. ANME-2c ERB4 TaxID=2759911 RepID=A0A7G9YKS7_9EURY|nr:hypothetical protein LKGCFIDI_00013 [Methanosarcinales archaeon ANME-2c ERB4]
MHPITGTNGSLFDDMIKLAATAKDMSEFERKPDRMARGYQGLGCAEAYLSHAPLLPQTAPLPDTRQYTSQRRSRGCDLQSVKQEHTRILRDFFAPCSSDPLKCPPDLLDQCINKYLPVRGIPLHNDQPSCPTSPAMSLTLVSAAESPPPTPPQAPPRSRRPRWTRANPPSSAS